METSQDLFVEIELPSGGSSRGGGGDSLSAAKRTAKAQKARGFDPAKALRGIGGSSSETTTTTESACTTRGDGRYSNGSNLLRDGNTVHIGPEAFKEGNMEETFKELMNYGAFGTKESKKEKPSEQKHPNKVVESQLENRSKKSLSEAAAGIEMVKNLESILTLSNKMAQFTKLDELGEIYDISQGEDSKVSTPKVTEKTFEPEYQLKWTPSEKSPQKLEVRVSMPSVSSMSEVTLTMIGKTLSIASRGKYKELKVSAEAIKSSSTHPLSIKAKWKKEKKILKVEVTKGD